MHLLEDLALLAADAHAELRAELRELRAEFVKCLFVLRGIYDHHHVEVSACDGLGDVEDVYVLFGEIRACPGEDTDGVLADDSDDDLFHMWCIIPQNQAFA